MVLLMVRMMVVNAFRDGHTDGFQTVIPMFLMVMLVVALMVKNDNDGD